MWGRLDGGRLGEARPPFFDEGIAKSVTPLHQVSKVSKVSMEQLYLLCVEAGSAFEARGIGRISSGGWS